MYLSILLTLPNVRYQYQYYSHFIDSKTDALRRTDALKQLVQDHTTNQWQNWDKNPFVFVYYTISTYSVKLLDLDFHTCLVTYK